MKTKDTTLVEKGKGFGPFRRFRIDTHKLADGKFVAKGYDAEKSDESGRASVFALVEGTDIEQVQIDCQRLIEASAEWLDAHTIAEKAWE